MKVRLIEHCADGYWGSIAWERQPGFDAHNPDPSKRGRPLLGTPVTPNQLTTVRLVTGLLACALFAVGDRTFDIWGGVIWVVSAFLDRADGELARIGGKTTSWGHAYDYACDTLVNAPWIATAPLCGSARKPRVWPNIEPLWPITPSS